jgi:hypothetical protein
MYQDINIIFSGFASVDNFFLKNRIQKALSFEKVDSFHNLKDKYNPNVIIPGDVWLDITTEELKNLVYSKDSKSSVIGIVKLPEKCFYVIKQLGISNVVEESDLMSFILNPRYEHSILPIVEYIYNNFCTNFEGFLVNPINWNQKNLKTITRSNINSKLIGIHVDSWDGGFDPEKRFKARNRICINIGTEARFFLFIPITVSSIYKEYGLNILEQNTPCTFFQDFNYPIYRIKVLPGEAYIACTENILHDASSLYQKNSDLQLTILGYFSIRP